MKTAKFYLVISLLFMGFAFANSANEETLSDVDIGLRHTDLVDENKLKVKDIDWNKEAPGLSQRYERSFENAPPLIPHDLDGLVPITKDYISCLDCHLPEVAKEVGSTAIPKTHMVDFRTGKDLQGRLSEERYNCTQCHVPQANTAPLVRNDFKPDFRYKDSNASANLIDILNQGIE